MKRYLLTGLLAAAIAIAGCAKESDLPNPTGEGSVRAINAIPTSPNISFLIEERLITSVVFRTLSTSSAWDDLDYTFNFEVLFGGDSSSTRVASQFIDIVADTDYTMLISGALDAPDITVWESSIREWTGDETFFELRIGHASSSLGPIDAYILDPGTAPVLGNQVDTLSMTEITTMQEIESAEKIIVLTPAGDDSTILFESQPLTLIAGFSYIIAAFDPDANDVSPFSVSLMNTSTSSTGRLVAINAESTGRFYHASINAPDVDIYVEDPLTSPIVSGQTFGGISGDLEIPDGDVPLTYTVAGNMGSIIAELDRAVAEGTRYNFYLSRNVDGEDVVTSAFLDRRSVETQARLSVAHMAANQPVVDVYVVAAGVSIDERLPVVPSLRTQSTPVVFPLPAGDYDVYVTEEDEKTIFLGPEPLSLALGDVVEAIIYDTVDPNVPEWFIVPAP